MSYAQAASKNVPQQQPSSNDSSASTSPTLTSSKGLPNPRQPLKGKKHGKKPSEAQSSDEEIKRTQLTGQINKAKNHDDIPDGDLATKVRLAAPGNPLLLLLPTHLFALIFSIIYIGIQTLIAKVFAPPRPRSVGPINRPRGRIAVIGGGLTGVSSAAHLIGHGFEVVIFEEHDDLGGIWSRVNTTSGLQLNSVLYRFFPSVRWSASFPKRAEILSEIARVADEYDLYSRTRLSTKVKSAHRHKASSTDPAKYGHGRWIINGNDSEVFDGLIVAVGTCGKPKVIELPKQDAFKGKIVHSSELDGLDLRRKKVAVIGAGASGVEAAELALTKEAKSVSLLARSAHWFIPRNLIISTSLALQPFGKEMPLSFIPEWFIKTFHYRSAKYLAPKTKGLYEGTPIVNDEFLDAVRHDRIQFLFGDTKELTSNGIVFNRRENGTKPGSKGVETVEEADVIVLATGFERPSVKFLPKDLFPARGEGTDMVYEPPNLFLQNFSVADWSICMVNSSYQAGLGSVGHVHIGMLTRILALFLVDERTRPLPADARLWVDFICWIKENSPARALGFFTYMEMTLWFISFLFFQNSKRIAWAPFVLMGFGVPPRE